ncbi:MAG: glutamate--tRNA ligase family protein, partial [Janthinobacterium lividum]
MIAPPPVQNYIGRFAPSPSGPLHAGSLVAAMASYLDARAHKGMWLLRIEDVDQARSSDAAAQGIIDTLQKFGMAWDGEVSWQSRHQHAYAAALAQLVQRGLAYPCGCSRREIADSRLGVASDGAAIYPGTC